MTAIPGFPTPQNLVAAASAETVALRPGAVVEARVAEDLGGNQYALRIGDAKLVVESQTPLVPGQTMALRVQENAGKITLEVLPANLAQLATIAADEALVSAPFTLSADLAAVAARLGTGTDRQPVIGLAPLGPAVALHFPDGGVVEARQGPSPTVLASPPLPTAASPAAPPLEALDAAAFIVRQALVQARIATPGSASVPVLIQTLPADLSALASLLVSSEASDTLSPPRPTAELLPATADADGVTLRIGEAKVRALALGVPLPSRGQVILEPDPLVHLAGLIRLSPDSAPPGAVPGDDRLRTLGLTPTPATREALAALTSAQAPLDRASIQALIALAAGREGPSRAALLAAGATMLAREIPLVVPAAAGWAGRAPEAPPLPELLSRARFALLEAAETFPADAPESPLLRLAALDLADAAIDPEAPDAEARLLSWSASFGRAPLGRAAAAAETAMAALLKQDPLFAKLDALLAALTPTGPLESLPLFSAPTSETDFPGIREDLLSPRHSPADPETATLPMRALLDAPDAETAVQRLRLLLTERPELLPALAARLEQAEREALSRLPAASRLADAAQALSDAGRRLFASKLESVAGLRQEPSLMVAEIPFRLGSEETQGRLQVYRRNAGRSSDSRFWTARILLDLTTTNLGPVVGDMQFRQKNLDLRLFAPNEAATEWLAGERQTLIEALREKGFSCRPRFLLIPPSNEPPAPAAAADGQPPPRSSGLDLRI